MKGPCTQLSIGEPLIQLVLLNTLKLTIKTDKFSSKRLYFYGDIFIAQSVESSDKN